MKKVYIKVPIAVAVNDTRCFRIYYWIRGAPEKRPGGPWWYQDFYGCEEMITFFTTFFPFLYAAMLLVVRDRELPEHECMKIAPPKEADPLFPQMKNELPLRLEEYIDYLRDMTI